MKNNVLRAKIVLLRARIENIESWIADVESVLSATKRDLIDKLATLKNLERKLYKRKD